MFSTTTTKIPDCDSVLCQRLLGPRIFPWALCVGLCVCLVCCFFLFCQITCICKCIHRDKHTAYCPVVWIQVRSLCKFNQRKRFNANQQTGSAKYCESILILFGHKTFSIARTGRLKYYHSFVKIIWICRLVYDRCFKSRRYTAWVKIKVPHDFFLNSLLKSSKINYN